jgi:hypothetical protein
VTATTTSAGKLGLLERPGAVGVVMDGLDAVSVGEAVAADAWAIAREVKQARRLRH